MHRIVGVVVIRLMARHASRIRAGQIVVAVRVATGTSNGCVCPGQSKACSGVIKRPVAPVGSGVALVAGLREASGYVIRIRRALEILQVALHAGAAGQVVGVVHVALCALQRRVSAG